MKKILIVEDNVNFLEEIFNQINSCIQENIKVEQIYTDGKKALEYLLKNNVDILLLDLNLPNNSGIQILEYINNNSKPIEVIIITGDSEMMIELLKKGLRYSDILIKPINQERLIESINEIINKICNEKNKQKIIKLLDEFNFNKGTKGYIFILDCIKYCVENKYYSISNIENLYKEVAENRKRYSSLSIGWNISKAVQSMNKFTDSKTMQKYFPYNIYPSPKVFLNEILNLYYSDI